MKNKKIRTFAVRLEDKEGNYIKRLADKNDMTISQYIRRALSYYSQAVEEKGTDSLIVKIPTDEEGTK